MSPDYRKSSRRESPTRPQYGNPCRRRIRRDIARRTIGSLLRLLVAGVVVFLVLIALYGQPFEVQDVSITGLETIPREQVESIATRLIGQNIFRAHTRAVRREILSLPEVKEVRIHRTLTRKIIVSLIGRKPFAAVPNLPPATEDNTQASKPGSSDPSATQPGVFRRVAPSDSKAEAATAPALQNPVGYTIIDATGFGFRSVNKVPAGLVIFRDAKAKGLPFGERLDPRVLADLRRCLGNCQETTMPYLRAAQRDAAEGMTVVFADGLIVRLGPDHWKEKLQLAQKTLGYVASQGKVAASIDLRSLEAPVWRPRGGNQDESTAKPHNPPGGDSATHRAPVEGKPG